MFKVIAFLMLTFPFFSNATVSLTGKVKSYTIEGGIVKFAICANGDTVCRGFWFKPEGDYAAAMLSIMLTAKATGDQIYAQGRPVADNPAGWQYGSNGQVTSIIVKSN
ncbi:hypothetical protein [Pseudoalteromonas luteoviolacea]|uniref:Uncharacterized protein n=1 Tax=Pseudoalteromonas luteoviolacea S4054 TaxID=1129367 RepID=A0A0F6ABM7_9GAMM|nr:hypothetical protein [Pseudoalteromonas luteoviolacea]AOT08822.1 hypothetical protein S4054249_13585 [Pseudoalteromonas luteoviolacea]AOT13735.1 hypothetical protein S40542_13555 [Pseudoalteromonas luteoviolacea]AOT18649.1 hypothetical protein S4054_13560 [Pseudoalteromonas luteoviolacea]KKE83617.1 hypothetical protein N479_13230 [Pseudoalteromonas luteoviolacea S4054]KZN72806.1 hypothetical protein N481_14365 [Pseudoalteromonas luteoviolacea S4047-1]